MTKYEPPNITEYGEVEEITESSGSNKMGNNSDEYSSITPLTGSIY